MPKVICIHPDGTRTPIETAAGASLMQAAVGAGIGGVLAECGGACQCATCHVFVETPWSERLSPAGEMEQAMLENTFLPSRPSSRLSCEITLTAELDGMEFHLPERQV